MITGMGYVYVSGSMLIVCFNSINGAKLDEINNLFTHRKKSGRFGQGASKVQTARFFPHAMKRRTKDAAGTADLKRLGDLFYRQPLVLQDKSSWSVQDIAHGLIFRDE